MFEAFPKEGGPVRAAGKFVAVLEKNDKGNWQFVVDAMSGAPISVFDEN